MNSQETTLAVEGSLLLNYYPKLPETPGVGVLYMNRHSGTNLYDEAATFCGVYLSGSLASPIASTR